MATYYVGSGGSDAADGLSWANRKLTLNGAEDVPVAAADTVYVAPGVYRHTLTVDVSGTAGNPITFIADQTGENTDGVGGKVRITGSDNDTSSTRNQCITATSKNYRTFRGFRFDMGAGDPIILISDCTNWIVEDFFIQTGGNANTPIRINGASQSTHVLRRGELIGVRNATGIDITHTTTIDNAAHVIENVTIIGPQLSRSIASTRVGGITVRNCTILNANVGVGVATALSGTATALVVNNCIIHGCATAVGATATAELTENFNAFSNCASPRSNVNVGANSNTYPALFDGPLLSAGHVLSPAFGALSQWSPLRAIAGTGTATDDLYGRTRPATAAKLSWGAVQHVPLSRETTTKRTGAASLKLADAGRHQMFVPVTAASTTFSVYCYREADYTGTNPQMIIKQPGVADTVVTDAGAAATWNQLTTTLTPAATPPYVIVELVSGNTAAATNFACFFDDVAVT